MKTFKIITILAAAVMMFASAQTAKAQLNLGGIATGVASTLTQANGNSVGGALLSLYTQYKADKKIDLSNPANISNILTIATNIKGLTSKSNTTNFLSGLISGSKNLVNNNNSGTVLKSLTSLAGLDMSSLATTAASAAGSSLLSKVSGASSSAGAASNQQATQAASILTSLFGQLQ